MRFKYVYAWIFIGLLMVGMINARTGGPASQLRTPEQFFGFRPGADRMLFNYEELVDYLQHLAAASPRIKMVEIGKSPMGRPMYIAFISDAENIRNLENLRGINQRLALDPDIPATERETLLNEGKVFVAGTLSMHSEEVAPAQAAPLIAFDLATTQDPQKCEWLKNVVYLMVPNHNPDGMDLVVDYYKKNKGTKYEGSSLPYVYHKYVGHDNNRDFVTLTQEDSRNIDAIFSQTWFPQVMVEKHGMGQRGARYFVPPNHDPIAENIDAGLWNWVGVFGSNMIKDMTRENLAGVTQHFMFDNYWIGSTESCLWKNVIAFLTEAAGAKVATPVFVEPNELRVDGKGLSEYKVSINMPLPWPGGWWKLSDLMQYECVSTLSILKTASVNRKDILQYRNDLCKKEVNNGKTKPPYYYILPLQQRDSSELVQLVELLKRHGINVYTLTADIQAGTKTYKKGDIVVPLSQAFRPFIKEVMESQEYPVRHYTPGGEIIKPYDITTWSLPLQRNLTCDAIDRIGLLPANFDRMLQKIDKPFTLASDSLLSFRRAIFTADNNESYKVAFWALDQGLPVKRLTKPTSVGGKEFPAGSFVIEFNGKVNFANFSSISKQLAVSPEKFDKDEKELTDAISLKMPRVALVETYNHDMDAGWTRYVLDTYAIPFKVLHPGDFEKINLHDMFDVIIFPEADKGILMKGKSEEPNEYRSRTYPSEYMQGIGKEGFNKLMLFLDGGGMIISWGDSTKLFMGPQEMSISKDVTDNFQLPVTEISGDLKKDGFLCPGSLLRLTLLPDHPLTWGMPEEVGVFYRGRALFRTSIPELDMDRRVIGKFPEKNILLSGYCEKEEKLGNQTALVWLKKNKGQMVLFGFGPQFRASTPSCFKLLFNAILMQH
ncbi:MAG: M14 family zinc carboxypeptidase [Candidatus Omnitrophota bacterium]